jgi:hypothetical protein
MRLANGWELIRCPGFPDAPITEFVRPAIRAVPRSLAARLGRCHLTLLPNFDDDHARTSEWTSTGNGLEISVAAVGEGHDVALEVLTCLGQALWERLSEVEESSYWRLLDAEILANISGEIDEQALDAKRLLLEDRTHARDPRCLEQYGVASFAATAAEYVHCLWHDVTIRTGEAYLPATQLRRRLELLARWFPPDRGYPLFPAPKDPSHGAFGSAASCSIQRSIRR